MKVIVAVDDSPYSSAVVEKLSLRTWPSDTQFKILTVLEPIDDLDEDCPELISEINEKRMAAANKYCEKTRKKLESGIENATVHYEIRTGSPQSEIVDAAVEWSADKIFVGAHGKGVCPHNLLGSVSRSIAAHAPCTVEVVRASLVAAGKEKSKN